MLTVAQAKALTILEHHGPLRPREFAKLMWPDSDGWRRRSKCGPSGVHKGGGMYLAAGGYLGRLRKKGWVYKTYGEVFGRYESLGYLLDGPGKKLLELHRGVEEC